MLLYSLLFLAAAAPSPAAEECRILAAVALDELSLGTKVAPPLQPAGAYAPNCAWRSLDLKGVARPRDWPRGRLIFHRPEIHGRTASVRYTVVYGPRTGGGYDCALVKRHGHWRVTACNQRIAM
jgi:hypothetical protein